jgi:predicted aspartyl protease
MIRGVVEAGEARIALAIRGPRGRKRIVHAVIDTGFTGALTLPAALVQALHLPWQNVVRGTLADGSTCLLELYEAALLWDRQWRPVLAVQSESAALVGMELLERIQVRVAWLAARCWLSFRSGTGRC